MSFSPTIASSLAKILLDRDERAIVSDVRIGLGYTGVMLEDGRAGVAYTFRGEAKRRMLGIQEVSSHLREALLRARSTTHL